MGSRDRNLDKAIRDAPLERGPHGLPMCRWCHGPVFPPRQTFCQIKCISEWRIRSDPSYREFMVEERDHGVCAECGLDTIRLMKELKEKWGSIPFPKGGGAKESKVMARKFEQTELQEVGVTFKQFQARNRLYDIDHVVPVALGGGSAGLDNLVTLCVPCHKRKTKKDMVEIREDKK